MYPLAVYSPPKFPWMIFVSLLLVRVVLAIVPTHPRRTRTLWMIMLMLLIGCCCCCWHWFRRHFRGRWIPLQPWLLHSSSCYGRCPCRCVGCIGSATFGLPPCRGDWHRPPMVRMPRGLSDQTIHECVSRMFLPHPMPTTTAAAAASRLWPCLPLFDVQECRDGAENIRKRKPKRQTTRQTDAPLTPTKETN